MPLIYAGIDEAGYGPLLGPLCVGMSVFRIDQWSEGDQAPNLWKHLSASVCRDPGDKRRRIAVDDSKQLKLPDDSPHHHPLTHLERGVLTFLNMIAAAESTDSPACPGSDLDLFTRVGASLPDEPWYAGEPLGCPVATTADSISVSCNMLRLGLERAGVRVLSLRCRTFGEGTFNELVAAGGSKAAATEAALVDHLWSIWDEHGATGVCDSASGDASEGNSGGVRVVCDRQGGRAYYSEMLTPAFPGAQVVETHAGDEQSRYEISGHGDDGCPRHMHVLFLVESERQHLPVALASMLAKLTRERMMARFNRFWCGRYPELKPTAGYRNDAWRWLADAGAVIRDDERVALIRRA